MAAAGNRPPRYLKACFRVPAALADDAAGLIVAAGALGCAIAAPFRPKLRDGRTTKLEAYFTSLTKKALLDVQQTLKAAGMLAESSAESERREIQDPGWSTMWTKRFEPMRIGRRLEIAPPWHVDGDGGQLRVIIKPGQAFGTGHHGTTRGVLRTIERLTTPRRFQSALDVGTGSGILALTMIKLGVPKVCAIDVDQIAIASAQENARLNGMAGKVDFSVRPLSTLHQRFDLITANIVSSTLIEIAAQLIGRLKPRGILIISGVLRRERSAVNASYARHLSSLSSSVDRSWATLVFQK
jgi:ribosomal protein L11 methyltransferase